MYLTYITDREYTKAIECSEKCIQILSDIYGPRTKKLASKYY